ncbi:MAG TPA: sodium:proton antiporter NhaD [Candidatus Azoamicus sp.]
MLVVLEEFIHIKKSSITIFFSSIMLFILVLSKKNNLSNTSFILNSFLSSYCELFLFLFVAMIYITTLKSLNFFNFIKNKILLKKLSLRQIYFFTGLLSFFISPFADNLTTSLIMSSIILNINKDDYTFVNLSCINIVIASNAGGTFSPFGDITTLMIWQSGMLKFSLFFKLFVPSLISFIIPSIIMLFFVKNCTIIHINLHHYANLSSDSKKCFNFIFFKYSFFYFFSVIFKHIVCFWYDAWFFFFTDIFF